MYTQSITGMYKQTELITARRMESSGNGNRNLFISFNAKIKMFGLQWFMQFPTLIKLVHRNNFNGKSSVLKKFRYKALQLIIKDRPAIPDFAIHEEK